MIKLRVAAGLLVIASAALAQNFSVPPPTAPVMDQASVLSDETVAMLNRGLRQVREQGGPQIGILIVSTLGGEPIESASIRVADIWKLGSKEKDDGVILLVAVKDRQ